MVCSAVTFVDGMYGIYNTENLLGLDFYIEHVYKSRKGVYSAFAVLFCARVVLKTHTYLVFNKSLISHVTRSLLLGTNMMQM